MRKRREERQKVNVPNVSVFSKILFCVAELNPSENCNYTWFAGKMSFKRYISFLLISVFNVMNFVHVLVESYL